MRRMYARKYRKYPAYMQNLKLYSLERCPWWLSGGYTRLIKKAKWHPFLWQKAVL